jgi:hypothetical protein
MVLTVAEQIAGAPENAVINESQLTGGRAGGNDRSVEVNQVRIVGVGALGAADTVRRMTYITGRILAHDMLVVFIETVVAQNALAVMA